MTSYNTYIPRTFYQYSHSFEERCRLSAQLRKRYRNYIPIIFEPEEQCQHVTTTNSVTHTSVKHCPNVTNNNAQTNNQQNKYRNTVQENNISYKYGHNAYKQEEDEESSHELEHDKQCSTINEKKQTEQLWQKRTEVCNYVMQNKEHDSVNKRDSINDSCNTIKTITNFLSPLPFAWAHNNWSRVQEYITNIQKCAENVKQEENNNVNKNVNYNNNNNKFTNRHNMPQNINSENCSEHNANDSNICCSDNRGSDNSSNSCTTSATENNCSSSSYAVNEMKTNTLQSNSSELVQYQSYSPSSYNVYRVRSSNHYVIKFVMPSRKTLSEVILTLRERLALHPHQAVFLTVGESDVLAPGNALLGELYERYKHPDGFLYIAYALENTFGSRSTLNFSLE